MEYETKVKIDPTRSEKVFSASQIMDAFKSAVVNATSEITKDREGGPPPHPTLLALLMLSISSILINEFEKALGIEGPDGAYIDKKK